MCEHSSEKIARIFVIILLHHYTMDLSEVEEKMSSFVHCKINNYAAGDFNYHKAY
jgi:hypothetical protein